ncbi:MAG: 2-nitropropane dioxygenase [Pseudonocardiales bacterium]|nr:MAG: 2-nitropropane dioxygenase [Pseudonocardiales bacterium]
MGGPPVQDLLRGPIVLAPLGGGPGTPDLVLAATAAGAFAFLAAGYLTAAAMTAEIAAVRAGTDKPFGVNVFLPGSPSADRDAIAAYLASLADDVADLGARLGDAHWDDDHWDAKITALLASPPALVSFTFGAPPIEVSEAFHAVGCLVAVTVTCPEEAVAAAASGADCVCVQGIEAGGHRGAFLDTAADHALLPLVHELAQTTDLPQIAAGGLMDAGAVSAVLAAGAVAAQCGTAFLRCPESGANPTYKAALADRRLVGTALTMAFSGRRARGLENAFMRDHPDAPAGYPEINNATRPLRAAAAAAGDPDRLSLWAGSGYRQALARPAAEIVERLTP